MAPTPITNFRSPVSLAHVLIAVSSIFPVIVPNSGIGNLFKHDSISKEVTDTESLEVSLASASKPFSMFFSSLCSSSSFSLSLSSSSACYNNNINYVNIIMQYYILTR